MEAGQGARRRGPSVIPWQNGGKRDLIVLTGGKAPKCIDAKDGSIIWQTEKDTVSDAATPVAVGDELLAGSFIMSITTNGAERRLALKLGKDRGGSLIYYQNHVYQHGGAPMCFDFKTGEMKWKGPIFGGECYSAILAEGKLIGCQGGYWARADELKWVVMYKATPEKYEELGKFKVNATYVTTPAIADGKLYVRLTDGVACYDLTK